MKTIMTASIVTSAGATAIGELKGGIPSGIPHSETSRPGFYFFVSKKTGLVHARFFVGLQRSAKGLRDTFNSVATGRTFTTSQLRKGEYVIYFLAPEKMKPLTTGFGKGQIKMVFTANHSSPYQTLSEMNRLLNDNFKFVLQNY